MVSVVFHRIRVVVFDLDDTLYAEREYVYSGYAAVAEWLAEKTAHSKADLLNRLHTIFDTTARARAFNQLLKDLDLAEQESIWVPAMIEVYRRHRPAIKLLPDAGRALDRWEDHATTALISDGDPVVQQGKIDVLGLNERIGTQVLTGLWGREFWKPHPRAFEYVEQKYSASGKELIYVADNPVKDFISPRARGWQTLRVRRPGGIYASLEPASEGHADTEVPSLDEVDLTS